MQPAFVDIETTGADLARHVPWEVAVIVGQREHVWQIRLTDEELAAADREAMRKIDFGRRYAAGFDEPVAPEEAAREIFTALHGATPVGVRVAFDMLFLRSFVWRHHWYPDPCVYDEHQVRVPMGWYGLWSEVPEDWPDWREETVRIGRAPREGEEPDGTPRQPYRGQPRWMDWDQIDLRPVMAERLGQRPPWPRTEDLARSLGVVRRLGEEWGYGRDGMTMLPQEPRHSALGDARFAKRIYEALYPTEETPKQVAG